MPLLCKVSPQTGGGGQSNMLRLDCIPREIPQMGRKIQGPHSEHEEDEEVRMKSD